MAERTVNLDDFTFDMPEMVPAQFRGHRFRSVADVIRVRRLEAIWASVKCDPTLTEAERKEILAIVVEAQYEMVSLKCFLHIERITPEADEPLIISGD